MDPYYEGELEGMISERIKKASGPVIVGGSSNRLRTDACIAFLSRVRPELTEPGEILSKASTILSGRVYSPRTETLSMSAPAVSPYNKAFRSRLFLFWLLLELCCLLPMILSNNPESRRIFFLLSLIWDIPVAIHLIRHLRTAPSLRIRDAVVSDSEYDRIRNAVVTGSEYDLETRHNMVTFQDASGASETLPGDFPIGEEILIVTKREAEPALYSASACIIAPNLKRFCTIDRELPAKVQRQILKEALDGEADFVCTWDDNRILEAAVRAANYSLLETSFSPIDFQIDRDRNCFTVTGHWDPETGIHSSDLDERLLPKGLHPFRIVLHVFHNGVCIAEYCSFS